MRRYGVTLLLVAALAASSAALATGGQSEERKDLALVRQATAKYHDVGTAVANGYVPMSPCVAAGSLGAMGIHYVNMSLVMEPGVDVEKPEMLLYVPAANGGFRLVGVEYYTVDADQDLATDADRPWLFGRGFDGPMPGHDPEESDPVHYDLHVWIWQANPSGMFAEFNPNLSC